MIGWRKSFFGKSQRLFRLRCLIGVYKGKILRFFIFPFLLPVNNCIEVRRNRISFGIHIRFQHFYLQVIDRAVIVKALIIFLFLLNLIKISSRTKKQHFSEAAIFPSRFTSNIQIVGFRQSCVGTFNRGFHIDTKIRNGSIISKQFHTKGNLHFHRWKCAEGTLSRF